MSPEEKELRDILVPRHVDTVYDSLDLSTLQDCFCENLENIYSVYTLQELMYEMWEHIGEDVEAFKEGYLNDIPSHIMDKFIETIEE
jgi:hypothetical protein